MNVEAIFEPRGLQRTFDGRLREAWIGFIDRFRASRLRANKDCYQMRRFYKRAIHLVYRFRYESHLKGFARKFDCADRNKSETNVALLHGTLPRVLKKLHIEMRSSKELTKPHWHRSTRQFRGIFCRKVRLFRGLSTEELCLLLNACPEIAILDDKYPCFHMHYPFTPKFIETFESNISTIMEYCSQGFLFGIGFPTEELTNLIAKTCRAEDEYLEFEVLRISSDRL